MRPTTKQNKCKFCLAPIPLSLYCCPRCWEKFEKNRQEKIRAKNREALNDKLAD